MYIGVQLREGLGGGMLRIRLQLGEMVTAPLYTRRATLKNRDMFPFNETLKKRQVTGA